MLEYKPFYNDWVDVSVLFSQTSNKIYKNYINVNLDIDFFNNLMFDTSSLSTYRITAVRETSKMLGANPALCFSGGIDSQAMIFAWKEADIKFDTFILVFKNDLNKQDVNHAREFCKTYDIDLKEIEIDIIQFLNRENYDYGLKYDSASPHFNTHYKLFNDIKKLGYTGICCGGNSPLRNDFDLTWGNNFERNPLNFIKYSQIENFPCIGNFLSFYPNLAWALALLTPPTNLLQETFVLFKEEDRKRIEYERYLNKVTGYRKVGFNIIPQEQKFTGFELVKKVLEAETNNGWEFEMRYRHPLEKILNHSTGISSFKFKDFVEEKINLIYSKNFTSG